ncbi:hypothetical protein BV898_02386 [Hypsibius exemplaris]|uniref:G-protein coupled receptors family 1 profile domain-containing protein n=1 Tax=Hypsibius exemplaris TaxID=2072580 RepID=A0A1W0X813_HYPEX|nr:hypothetical protein BV898_02386 [Hypsibius exemplaris]
MDYFNITSKLLQYSYIINHLNNSPRYSNLSRPVEPHVYYHKSVLFWLSIVLSGNFFGILANSVIAVTTLTYKPIRTCSSSSLIAHCAILDIIRSTFAYPGASLLGYLTPFYGFPVGGCRYFGGMISLINYTTNWAYCCLAGHRLCATILPHHYRFLIRTRSLISINLLPWIISIILLALPFFEAGSMVKFVLTAPWSSCQVGPLDAAAAMAILGLGTYFPCALCVGCYVTILIQAKMTALRCHSIGIAVNLINTDNISSSPQPIHQRRYEMCRMLFGSSLWTLASTLFLPAALSWFPDPFFADNYPAQIFMRLPQYLASAFNPV